MATSDPATIAGIVGFGKRLVAEARFWRCAGILCAPGGPMSAIRTIFAHSRIVMINL
jgi:hypothetical protein